MISNTWKNMERKINMETSEKGQGYLQAKRQMVAAIDYRIQKYHEELVDLKRMSIPDSNGLAARIDELEKIRSYVRNAMLWKVEDSGEMSHEDILDAVDNSKSLAETLELSKKS